jgi:hypothetical protein
MIHTNKGFCKTGQVLLEDIFHVVPLKVATTEKKKVIISLIARNTTNSKKRGRTCRLRVGTYIWTFCINESG